MKKRLLSLALTLALALSLGAGTARAGEFKFPNAYWPLQTAWQEANEAQDTEQVVEVAGQIYDLLTPYGMISAVCLNLEPKCALASWASEMNGDLSGAVMWAKRQRTFADWLDKNEHSYQDTLINLDARLAYLKAGVSPAIYALTSQQGKAFPGSGAVSYSTLYGTPAEASRTGESAVLLYVTFGDSLSVDYWIDYYKRINPSFKQIAEQGGVIELAWNFEPQSTAGAEAVLAADSYIAESLDAMSKLNATVLLRVGAEMNNWSDCDPDTYIRAFRKVATAARAYDNIRLVFSPDNVNNRNVSFSDFYPGDEYVDWVGVSTYHTANYAGYNGQNSAYSLGYSGYGNDAYYGLGIYDSDPLVIFAPIVRFAEEHGKPMMISECGFSYYDRETGADQTGYAVEQLTKFYSYVNMIYPQVKAVFHFNNTLDGERYAYRLADNAPVNAAYNAAVSNGSFLSLGETTGRTWHSLAEAEQGGGSTMRLATYVSFPGKGTATVRYYVDSALAGTVNEAPYYFDLKVAGLSAGQHTICAEVSSDRFTASTQTYTIRVHGNGAVSGQEAPASAQPSRSAILVDGREVSFEAYNIADHNYFKLRDLAYALNGSAAQFDVGWDGDAGVITLISGQSYTAVGGEMVNAGGGAKTPLPSSAQVSLNGAVISLTAYNIDGNNYFKLRDLADAMDFEVDWDSARGRILVDTTKSYTPD